MNSCGKIGAGRLKGGRVINTKHMGGAELRLLYKSKGEKDLKTALKNEPKKWVKKKKNFIERH